MKNRVIWILFCLLMLLSCSNSKSDRYYVRFNNIFRYGNLIPVKKLNFQTNSFIEKPDSLIINEFCPFDSTVFERSYLYVGTEDKLIDYFNTKPFGSFFHTNIKKIKIQLFDSCKSVDEIVVDPSRLNDKIYMDSCEEHTYRIYSTDYLYEHNETGNFHLKGANEDGTGNRSYREVVTLFTNVISHASNSFTVSDLNLRQSDYLEIDSLLKEKKFSFKKHPQNAKSIIDSVKKYPYCLKSYAATNFMRIELINDQNDTLKINDCSQELPTGIIWIFRLKSNYLKCYDFRVCDFIKQNISPKHKFYQYLNRSWSLLMQYESMNEDLKNNCIYFVE